MRSNSQSHRTFTTKFRAEVVCEFAVRAGPGRALPFERPGTAGVEAADPPAGGCGLELTRFEAVLTGAAQDASCLAVT
jgi:hypothetical protein